MKLLISMSEAKAKPTVTLPAADPKVAPSLKSMNAWFAKNGFTPRFKGDLKDRPRPYWLWYSRWMNIEVRFLKAAVKCFAYSIAEKEEDEVNYGDESFTYANFTIAKFVQFVTEANEHRIELSKHRVRRDPEYIPDAPKRKPVPRAKKEVVKEDTPEELDIKKVAKTLKLPSGDGAAIVNGMYQWRRRGGNIDTVIKVLQTLDDGVLDFKLSNRKGHVKNAPEGLQHVFENSTHLISVYAKTGGGEESRFSIMMKHR